MAATQTPVIVDVWSDVVCPWCHVGHASLERAIAGRPPSSVIVRPRAFQLDPSVPEEGITAEAYAEAKFGSAHGLDEMRPKLEEAGAVAGATFGPLPSHMPNTRVAHRAVALIAERALPAALPAHRALLRARHEEGAALADADEIAAVLETAGVVQDGAPVAEALADPSAGEAQVREDLELAQRLQIAGVPFFVAGGRAGATGAQPPEVLAELLDRGAQLQAETEAEQDAG